ncbi:MAG: ECF transporter S component [Clostridia bacterium]|nr:ECF transporter S component [Clostridia bacterium]
MNTSGKNDAASRQYRVRAIVVTAIMGAAGAALMFVEFSIPIMPVFIKLDFSEIPALLAAFAYGPGWGVLVCLIKNLLHMPFGSTMAIGELSNFILGSAFTLTAGLIYKRSKTKKTAIAACLIGSFAMAAVSVPANYFVIYKLFFKYVLGEDAIIGMYSSILPAADNLIKALLIFNLPFTLCKGLIDSFVCILLYKHLSPFIKGKKSA